MKHKAKVFLGSVLLGVSIGVLLLHLLLAALGRPRPEAMGPTGYLDLLGTLTLGWAGLELLNLKRFVRALATITASVIPLMLLFRLDELWKKAICLVFFALILVPLLFYWRGITAPEAEA